MKHPRPHLTIAMIFLLFSIASSVSHTQEDFVQCLQLHNTTQISKLVYTRTNSSYSSVLKYSIHNHRFASKTTPKPLVIVTPRHASHVQATIICSQRHGLQIRTRSGGHDFEGVSYTSQVPFVVIDLIKYRKIEVDVEKRTAWVQAGATTGELYYRINEKSKTLAFPAGVVTVLLFSPLSLTCSSARALDDDTNNNENFIQCFYQYSNYSTSTSKVVYAKSNSSYSSILKFSIHNLRFETKTTPKPHVIVTPLEISQVQATIICSKRHGMQIRTRSGGHDYEGLSYVSEVPFIIIDLINLSQIDVDADSRTAWVQAGATIGQLYYTISQQSNTLGFPAAVCATVGVGGQFNGGGYGFLMRKYGLAADNIIDAHIIDVNGRFLDREAMCEDLFWAIRGGGRASFGVIISWKIKLVSVPSTVTVFRVARTLEQNATELVHKWHLVANKLDKNLTIRIDLQRVNSSTKQGGLTVQATFESMFLGTVDQLIPLMQKSFPELGLVKQDCTEVSWIQSVLYLGGFSITQSPKVLLNRTQSIAASFKGKSDYVTIPIPESALEGLWPLFYEDEAQYAIMIFNP
ncbi:hypothetical protein PIB30_047056 [Stylosanthes scabra]|uniref:FAD-binding PCMH-type domain-containing protein n=1 Tax=Stylosanthes scabra TaxID=79078 RepID=A0ABU6UIR6_9FABA|nr:hypothetical protein [Stylosanthes scabra]